MTKLLMNIAVALLVALPLSAWSQSKLKPLPPPVELPGCVLSLSLARRSATR